MANFPTSLPDANPTADDLNDADDDLAGAGGSGYNHATEHGRLTGEVRAVAAKVGVDGSADTSSIDFKINNLGGVLAGSLPNPSFAADMATQAELDAHVNDVSAAHAASAISVSPTGNIAATDVQAALAELDGEKAASSHGHAASDITSGTLAQARIATGVASSGTAPVSDGAGNTAWTDVAAQSELDAHLADTVDAHDASAISVADSAGVFAGVDVETVLAELRADRTTFANADYTVLATDRYVAQTGTLSAARTVTLPAASGVPAGWRVTVADESGTVTAANSITVQRAGSDTLNGGTSVTLTSPYEWREFVSDGTSKWTSNTPKALVDSTDIDATVDEGADTVSLSVIGIRGNTVDAGAFAATDVGRGYSWDGNSFAKAGLPVLLAADGGGSTITNSAAEASIISATFDIPANSLRAGDVIEILASGTITNNTGANRTYEVFCEMDGVEVAPTVSGNVATNTFLRTWRYMGYIRIASIGASGSASSFATLDCSQPLALGLDTTASQISSVASATIDTTQPITFDVRGQLSVADTQLSLDPNLVIVRKWAS